MSVQDEWGGPVAAVSTVSCVGCLMQASIGERVAADGHSDVRATGGDDSGGKRQAVITTAENKSRANSRLQRTLSLTAKTSARGGLARRTGTSCGPRNFHAHLSALLSTAASVATAATDFRSVAAMTTAVKDEGESAPFSHQHR